MQVPLSVEFFRGLTLRNGSKVGSVRMLNGHLLVWKIPMPECIGKCGLKMPDQYRARAVGNLCAIKGFVVASSAPWTRKKVKTTWAFDQKAGQEMPTHKVSDAARAPSEIAAGDCIVFNSYNVAHVEVEELDTYLVVVREIDVEMSWSPDYDSLVELGDWAMTHGKSTR